MIRRWEGIFLRKSDETAVTVRLSSPVRVNANFSAVFFSFFLSHRIPTALRNCNARDGCHLYILFTRTEIQSEGHVARGNTRQLQSQRELQTETEHVYPRVRARTGEQFA